MLGLHQQSQYHYQDDIREQRRILATVENLEEDFEAFTLALGDLSLLVEQLEAEIDSGDLPAARVQRTAVYLRAMTMLTRAQLEIDRTNLGFAAEQVALARADFHANDERAVQAGLQDHKNV